MPNSLPFLTEKKSGVEHTQTVKQQSSEKTKKTSTGEVCQTAKHKRTTAAETQPQTGAAYCGSIDSASCDLQHTQISNEHSCKLPREQ